MTKPKFFFRIIRDRVPFADRNVEEIVERNFMVFDAKVGTMVPDLCPSVYRMDSADSQSLAKILVQHAATTNPPLSQPWSNLALVDVTNYILSRRCQHSLPEKTYFQSLNDAHYELELSGIDDLKIFAHALGANFESILSEIKPDDIKDYLADCIKKRDPEWQNLVSCEDLRSTWYKFSKQKYKCSLSELTISIAS